jgi:asparagine synthase (glutamine-hydrolysing)
MCGIVGIIDRSGGTRICPRTVEQMVAAIRHRGPDGTRIEMHGQVAFGLARLSIIDLAGGMQPMWNERRTVLSVCNGEIFNYRELREQLTLQGVRFRTDSDTEVIPFLYERYGPHFVDHLDGQYSIAIYDLESGTLVLTRDPFGITPLFYAEADGFFLFASEIKALLVHPSMKREVNLLGLDQTFMLPGLVSPVTMFKGVSSVRPGCQLLVEPERTAQSRQYWDVSFDTDPSTQLNEDAAIEALDNALRTAVTHRLIADVPIGVYLSGGLDSTLIAALVVEQAPSRTFDAFGAIVAEGAYSEARYQRQAARAVGAHLRSVLVEREDIARELPNVIRSTECPLRESFDVAALMLSRRTSQAGVKVVLAGQGADELFGGYVGYRFDAFQQHAAPSNATSEEIEIRRRMWGDDGFVYEHDYFNLRRRVDALYTPGVRDERTDAIATPSISLDKLRGLDPLQRRTYADLKLRLADHLLGDHGDRMTFAHGVEARYPFLSRQVIDVARRLPAHLKVRKLREKFILREVARSRVPHEIIEREKFGFAAPGADFLIQNDSSAYIAELLSEKRLHRDGYFDPRAVADLVASYRQSGFRLRIPFEVDLLFVVITFGIFLDQFDMPRRG